MRGGERRGDGLEKADTLIGFGLGGLIGRVHELVLVLVLVLVVLL